MDAMPFNSFIDGSENDNDTGLLQKAEEHSHKQVKHYQGNERLLHLSPSIQSRVFNQGQVSDGVLFCEFCDARIF